MKTKNILKALILATAATALSSCEDFLDKEPLSKIDPKAYFNTPDQLKTYVDNLYQILPSHGGYSYGLFGEDNNTDNQAGMWYSDKYSGQWKVPSKDGDWNFDNIYKCNWFLNNVLPKKITGQYADHYIGEVYFIRAFEYFNRYQKFGDFPIIKDVMQPNMDQLCEASKRMPRNEVARFILSDLDEAIKLMGNSDMKKTRISKQAALLLKSRVALFEGTWLKYFKNTAFVPNGTEWPGKNKQYNANYSYPTGSIDKEIEFFLTQAMDASKQIADVAVNQLVNNTGVLPQTQEDININPYFNMFSANDMEQIPEVLMWRDYDKGLGITHCVAVAVQFGDYGVGATRGLVDGFLMNNGLPIYDPNSGYKGDATIANVRKDRDSRLNIFLKEPGQKNILIQGDGDHAVPIEPYPNITNGNSEKGYSTGYALRKGGSFDQNQCGNNQSYYGCIIFRSAEALLNYMEACYEKNGSLDGDAQRYWKALRKRAGLPEDYNITINATNVSKEAVNDWGAYSQGNLVDKTLYNIRRERRCELMAEGLRFMDLCRWRAMDQMITTPYHIEGIHLWNTPMQDWYKDKLVANGGDNANVSSPSVSEYLRPYAKNSKSNVRNGYTWKMAYYLTPIANRHFLLTSPDSKNTADSPIYQNPYWPIEADAFASK